MSFLNNLLPIPNTRQPLPERRKRSQSLTSSSVLTRGAIIEFLRDNHAQKSGRCWMRTARPKSIWRTGLLKSMDWLRIHNSGRLMNSCSCRRCVCMQTFIALRAGRVSIMFGVAFPHRSWRRSLGIKPEAKFVVASAYDFGWTTNVPIEYFLKEDSLLAWSHDGAPIPPEHGGPVRLIIPQLYAWKSAKWVKGLRFLSQDQAGFWEEGGYHMRGNPWAGGDGERFRWS